MSQGPDRNAVEQTMVTPLWQQCRARRRRRREVVAAAANLFALHALTLGLVLALRHGRLEGLPGAGVISDVVIYAVAAFDLVLLWRPALGTRIAERAVTTTGELVLRPITYTLVTAVWLLIWPLARTVGRRGIRRRHPHIGPWVAGHDWRTSTWTDKTSEADSANRRQGSHLLRTLGWFIERRSFFLLLVVLLLLVAVSLSVFAQTPTLAPFVYSIF
jgi:hypothetical protein